MCSGVGRRKHHGGKLGQTATERRDHRPIRTHPPQPEPFVGLGRLIEAQQYNESARQQLRVIGQSQLHRRVERRASGLQRGRGHRGEP